MAVRIRLRDLGAFSVALKVKFPKQLRYISASSYLTVDDSDSRFDPANSETASGSSYLVFYVNRNNLGDDENGIVSFEVTGDKRVEDGLIEVDVDIDDPHHSNSSEFEPTDPKFDAQDAVTIQVRGEPDVTPTPTATAAASETPT